MILKYPQNTLFRVFFSLRKDSTLGLYYHLQNKIEFLPFPFNLF